MIHADMKTDDLVNELLYRLERLDYDSETYQWYDRLGEIIDFEKKAYLTAKQNLAAKSE